MLAALVCVPASSAPAVPADDPVRRGKAREGKVVLRWTSSPGADAYRVLVRRAARSKDWRKAGDTARRRLTIRD